MVSETEKTANIRFRGTKNTLLVFIITKLKAIFRMDQSINCKTERIFILSGGVSYGASLL